MSEKIGIFIHLLLLLHKGIKEAGLDAKQKFVSIKASLKRNFLIHYKAVMSPELGILIAQDSYGRAENAHGGFDHAPDRWSAIAWPLWKIACFIRNGGDTSVLEYIVLPTIINEKTIETLDDAMKAAGKKKFDDKGNPTFTTWTPDDDGFYAALATGSGAGKTYFLADNSQELKKKTIESITIYYPGGPKEPTMLWKLGSFCG